MHIVFFGPEGSGKGTQSKLLSEKLGLPVLTSGDLVREAAASDRGIIGEACRKALSQGKYVADSEMFVLWKRRLKRKDAKSGWIMDGFPRNLEQAKFLDEKIDKYGYKVEKVFYLRLSPEESTRRLIERARPVHPGSSELHDTPEKIQNRLAIYQQQESAVLEYYRGKGVLVEINGDQSIEAVHRDIVRHLEQKSPKKELTLVALVGMPGAGKSVAADYFRACKYPVLRFGDEVDQGLSDLGKPLTEANERRYREKLRQELGMAAMAIKIEPRIHEASKTDAVIVLDGLYSWEEYVYLKERFPTLILLCIYAPRMIRHQRLSQRPVRPLTRQEAESRDLAQLKNLNSGGPIAIADYLVKNEESLEQLHHQLDKFRAAYL